MRQFPAPLPSITPIGVFVHLFQITNFTTSAGTWPVYDVTTQTLTEISNQESIGGGGSAQIILGESDQSSPVESDSTSNVAAGGGTSSGGTSVTSGGTPTPNETNTNETNADEIRAENSSDFDAMLVGGLDYRSGDLDIGRQEKLFKEGFGLTTNVKAFRYNTSTKNIKEFLSKNPKIPIFLFSAGCAKTLDLASDPNVDKKTLFVIEPYGVSQPTRTLIEKAIREGLPAENVYVGSYPGVGSTISGNTSKNPKGIGGSLGSHWGALKYVAELKSGLAKK